MQQQNIYELEVKPEGVFGSYYPKKSTFTYFSNLKKCVEQTKATLANGGWEPKINYTAAYRTIKLGKNYQNDYKYQGQDFFRIFIRKKVINPNISSLGIEQIPNF